MSRRFGRNQKRKAREELLKLQSALYRSEMRLKESLELHKDYIAKVGPTIDCAKRIIGVVQRTTPNSAFLDRARIRNEHLRAPVIEALSPFLGVDGALEDRPIDIRCIDLFDLELSIAEDCVFKRMIHFDLDLSQGLHGGSKRVSYRLSMEAFQHMPTEAIVKELVDLLKEQL